MVVIARLALVFIAWICFSAPAFPEGGKSLHLRDERKTLFQSPVLKGFRGVGCYQKCGVQQSGPMGIGEPLSEEKKAEAIARTQAILSCIQAGGLCHENGCCRCEERYLEEGEEMCPEFSNCHQCNAAQDYVSDGTALCEAAGGICSQWFPNRCCWCPGSGVLPSGETVCPAS